MHGHIGGAFHRFRRGQFSVVLQHAVIGHRSSVRWPPWVSGSGQRVNPFITGTEAEQIRNDVRMQAIGGGFVRISKLPVRQRTGDSIPPTALNISKLPVRQRTKTRRFWRP